MRRNLGILAVLFSFSALCGCAVSTHGVSLSTLGEPKSSADLLAVIDEPGSVEVETIAACDWAVDRGGLINLSHPKAKDAGLEDGLEAIQVFFHVIRHPDRGVFLIDTGVERALRDAPDKAAIRGLVSKGIHSERMKFHEPLGDWLAAQPKAPEGVFLTHAHLDHLGGVPDLPPGTQLYSGPEELEAKSAFNLIIQSSSDRALAGKPPVQTWRFEPDATGRFDGVVDVFGDGLVWALLVPGHTAGSTAYLVRTPHGPVLFVGDASHTRWGWEHDVEPGSYSSDVPRSVESLKRLRALAAEHPVLEVRLGHQR
jgi:N-acyl homoserine lactone hydrolase